MHSISVRVIFAVRNLWFCAMCTLNKMHRFTRNVRMHISCLCNNCALHSAYEKYARREKNGLFFASAIQVQYRNTQLLSYFRDYIPPRAYYNVYGKSQSSEHAAYPSSIKIWAVNSEAEHEHEIPPSSLVIAFVDATHPTQAAATVLATDSPGISVVECVIDVLPDAVVGTKTATTIQCRIHKSQIYPTRMTQTYTYMCYYMQVVPDFWCDIRKSALTLTLLCIFRSWNYLPYSCSQFTYTNITS